MFYGEIEDLEEARKYVASLPYVDPNRIYLVGHSTGGTKALLLSEYSKGFRAVFSMGALPDFFWATEKTTMIAQKILADTGAKTNIQFTAEDLEKISKNIVK